MVGWALLKVNEAPVQTQGDVIAAITAIKSTYAVTVGFIRSSAIRATRDPLA